MALTKTITMGEPTRNGKANTVTVVLKVNDDAVEVINKPFSVTYRPDYDQLDKEVYLKLKADMQKEIDNYKAALVVKKDPLYIAIENNLVTDLIL